MSFFTDLQAKATAEIAALKTDLAPIEARIEAAFNLGAAHHAMQVIEASAVSLEEKIKAAFKLGQQSK